MRIKMLYAGKKILLLMIYYLLMILKSKMNIIFFFWIFFKFLNLGFIASIFFSAFSKLRLLKLPQFTKELTIKLSKTTEF